MALVVMITLSGVMSVNDSWPWGSGGSSGGSGGGGAGGSGGGSGGGGGGGAGGAGGGGRAGGAGGAVEEEALLRSGPGASLETRGLPETPRPASAWHRRGHSPSAGRHPCLS